VCQTWNWLPHSSLIAVFSQQTTGGYLMSVLGKIVSAILGRAGAAPAPGPSTSAARAAPTASATPKASSAPAGASAPVDVAAILTKLAASNKERLDWKKSIVDLMKLLKLDSSLAARKELADELHYTGDKKDSATMNIWLHKQVMLKLAENGGKVPDELRK
jgi:Domain of unknown function (DUF3597)